MAGEPKSRLTNFYDLIEDLDDPYFNPNPRALQHPFRCCIVGATGSGKSNLLLNVITTSNNFARIWICTKMPDEPLYKWLAKTLRDELESEDEVLTIVQALSDLPQHDDYLRSGGQQLVVVDDFVSENEKAHKPVKDLAIMGRKLGHRGVSLIYISQTFYDIPKMIRSQSSYIILKRIGNNRELRTIVKNFGLNIGVDELQALYNQTALDPFSMFLIDLVSPDESMRFRLNF